MESAHSSPSPKTLGDFEIIGEIGRGGMGVVYEARQKSLNRRVALKVLSSGLGLTTKAVARFRREAEAAAKLHHTNIVPIYATGEEHGVHFYAMELVDGPSLDRVIRQMRVGDARTPPTQEPDSTVDSPVPAEMPDWVSETMAYRPESAGVGSAGAAKTSDPTGSGISSGTRYFDQVARVIADVADALQHAHEEGVIHRDIKPSNLLLSNDGRLSLNDFGLARVLEQPGMTMSGEFVGSPLYMSPEQISAGRAPLDHRTDVYSLGATLYELLTLGPPFPGQQRDQVIGQILHKDPVPPRRSNRRVPLDLETICLKAMEKDPDRRYQTAGQMADDLRRFVNRFAISARRIGPAGRVMKWMRRNRTTSVLLLLLGVALAFVGALQYARCRDRRGQVEELQNDALAMALSGDFDQASSKIASAEELGAAPGWIHLMKGQLKMLQGDYLEARVELEQAAATIQDSAAAPAMLALSYGMTGQEAEHLRRLAVLRDIHGGDFQGFLLKGWAFSIEYPQIAKTQFAKARQFRTNSSALLVLESIALTRSAIDTTDPNAARADIETALHSTSAVRAYRQDDPLAISWHVMARCVAARVYEELHATTKASSCMEDVPTDVQLLKRWPGHVDARWARATYFEQIGSVDQMIADFTSDVSQGIEVDNYLALWCASKLFARREFDRSRWALEQIQGEYQETSRYAQSYLRLTQIKNEPERKEFHNEYVASLDHERRTRTGSFLIFEWSVLRLLGDEEHARHIAGAYVDAVQQQVHDDAQLAAGAYMRNADGIPEAQLIAKSRDSQIALCRAHFVIAIDRLARGDRSAAQEHFGKVVRTRYREAIFFWWSHAFLETVSDADWLPWLKSTR